MLTTTATMTTSTSTTTVIHLTPLPLDRAHFEKRAHALLDIRGRFHSPQNKRFDTLSQKLSIWINTFIREMAPQSLESVEKIKERTAPYFTYLEKKILRDELCSAEPDSPIVSLETPVMAQKEALEEKQDAEEDLVWEKNVYLRCRVVCQGISPFNDRPMPAIPTSHEYAQAVIDWKATLFSDARESFFNREVTVMTLPTEEQQAEERERFEELAQYVKMRRTAKKNKQKTQAILRAAETSEQETCALLVQRRDQVALEEAGFVQQLQRTLDFCQEQIDEMTRLTVSQKQGYDENIRFLEGYLKTAEENNLSVAAEIRKDLAERDTQQAQTNKTQETAIAALKEEQTQKVAELKTHQTLMETRHQTEILQQQNFHKHVASGLKKEVGDLKVEVTATKNDLSLSQQITLQQKQRLQQLDATNASLERQVADAVRRANNAKEVVICALM